MGLSPESAGSLHRVAGWALAPSLLLLALAAPGNAEAQVHVGAELSASTLGGTGVGARAVVDLTRFPGWEAHATYGHFFPERHGPRPSVEYWEVTLGGGHNFSVTADDVFVPYLGLGMTLARTDLETGRGTVEGANALGGLKLAFEHATVYAQARLTLGSSINQLVLTGGITLP